MKVFGEEQLCPCYKEHQEFQKHMELKDCGLVVCCHRPRTEDVRHAEAVESAVNTTSDVFILCNKRNVKITSSELTSELEKEKISCPRCRKIFEHAQELLQEVKSIDRKLVMGICDHCRKKAKASTNLFCSCDKTAKKFISVKSEEKEDTKKYFKTLPLKMGNLRKNTMVDKQNQNAYSDFQINHGLNSPASRHEPEIQQMFSHTHYNSDATELSKTNLKEGHVKQTVAFIQPIEPVKTSSAHTPPESENINTIIPGTLLVDSETTFVDTYVGLKELPRPSLKDRKQEEIFEDRPSMDAKEALKRRHDLSLRQMMRLEKDSAVPYSVSKRPYIYETPKIAPWAQKEPTSKYDVESEMDIKIPTLKRNRGPRGTRDLDYVSNREVKSKSTKPSQYSHYEPSKADKYHHDKMKQRFFDSEEGSKKVQKLGNRYNAVEKLKLQRSVDKISHTAKKQVQHVTKSKTGPIETVENIPEHQYRFFFPTLMGKEEKQVKVDVSSSHLIKDIQEKFHLQAEREKKKEEEERQIKHEQAQNKKLTREGKILQFEEKKRQDVEDHTKYEKEQRKLDHKQKKNEEENDGEIISEPNVKGKISKVSMVAEKEVMPNPDHRDNTDGVSEKNKMDVEVKPGDDETQEKGSKDLKSGTKQKDKMTEVSKKAKTDLKAKLELKDKDKPFTLKGKISKVFMVGKKHVMPKPDHRDKTDGVREKNKMDVKLKPGDDEATEKGSKDLKSGTKQKDKITEVSQKVKTDLKAKLELEDKDKTFTLKGKISKVSMVGKKHVMPKPDHRDKTDGVSEKNKMDVKLKPGDDEATEKGSKDLKSGTKQKDKMTEVSEKAKTDLKAKLELEDKDKPFTLKGKISKVSMVGKKHAIPKPDHRDKTDGVSEKNKMDVKVKPGDDEATEKGSKDLKSGTKQKDKMNEVSQKAKTDLKAKLELEDKDKPFTLKGKISKVSMVGKKHAMPKPDHRDKTDGVSEKTKMDVKLKSVDDEATEKGSKGLKSRTKQEDKMNEVSEKAKTDLEAKLKQEDKGVAKEQKIKPEKEDPNELFFKNLITKSRQEREARKDQVVKDKEQIVKDKAPSKKETASKPARNASDGIEVTLSKIQESLKKATTEKQKRLFSYSDVIFEFKQGKGKESEKISKPLKRELSMPLMKASELQKLKAQHLKEKHEALKNKIQLENEAKLSKAKEDADHEVKGDELGRRRDQKKQERSEENIKLDIIKQAMKMGPSDIHPEVLKIHKCNHQHSGKKSPFCKLCLNSDLEIEVLSLNAKKKLKTDKTDIIIGEKIFKNKPRLEKIKEPEGVPLLFQKEFCVESDKKLEQIIPQETKPEQKQILLTKIKMKPGKGVIHYALSDRTFIDKGWTMLPTEKVVRKMNVYRMRPARPEFDWFENNKNKRLMTYDTGERLAEFEDNGRGRWYYRNNRLALDYYDAEETNAQQRIVIYSSGEPDERGRTHPVTILAIFDYLGNGIVFDHAGKIRLKYNQTEGVVLDRGIGPVSHWQWHSLNDPPVLQQVMIDTQMAHTDPNILNLGSASDTTTQPDHEMLAIEFDNFIKEKSKKLSQKFKPFQIRMKALKINEHFSLKILDQATVYLIFRDGSTNLKLNIGMTLDHQEIVDVDTAEVGEVSNSLERFPARTDSLEGLQRSVAHAQRYERQRTERERWLRPPGPYASADHLTAAASPPMRLPLRTVPMGSSSSTGYRCSRKPTNNLYYDTRLRS